MNKIYLVIHCTGNYDSYQEQPIKAFKNQFAAEAMVAEMRKYSHELESTINASLNGVDDNHPPLGSKYRWYVEAIPFE